MTPEERAADLWTRPGAPTKKAIAAEIRAAAEAARREEREACEQSILDTSRPWREDAARDDLMREEHFEAKDRTAAADACLAAIRARGDDG